SRLPGRTKRAFDSTDPKHTELEAAAGLRRVALRRDSRAEVLWFTCTPAGDERDRGDVPSRGDQFHVEAVPGTVGVHRVQQHLADAAFGGLSYPVQRVHPRRAPPAMSGHLESGRLLSVPANVHAEHQHLTAEPGGDLVDHIGSGDRGGVDSDLVRAGPQQDVHILDAAHTAADSQRNEYLFRSSVDDLQRRAAPLCRGGDVQERELVRALGVIDSRHLDRVPRVGKVDEVDPLDHPAGVHVETRNHPDGEAHARAALSACGNVNEPAYSALPTMAPSTPIDLSDASARMSSRLETPPE